MGRGDDWGHCSDSRWHRVGHLGTESTEANQPQTYRAKIRVERYVRDEEEWEKAVQTRYPFLRGGLIHIFLEDLSKWLDVNRSKNLDSHALGRWMRLTGAEPDKVNIRIGGSRTSRSVWMLPEYWRFDETGEFHGTRLAGDRLVDGRYEPVPIETVEEGVLQGYSGVLNLLIRREHGQMGWHDTKTEQHIATFAQERARAERERARADIEREARMAAEARVRELERRGQG